MGLLLARASIGNEHVARVSHCSRLQPSCECHRHFSAPHIALLSAYIKPEVSGWYLAPGQCRSWVVAAVAAFVAALGRKQTSPNCRNGWKADGRAVVIAL